MKYSLEKPIPTKKEFLINVEKKITDNEFLGDIVALLRPEEKYDYETAFKLVTETLIAKM